MKLIPVISRVVTLGMLTAVALSSAAAQTASTEAKAVPAYILHSGDTLDIKVYNLPELNQGLVIRPDGAIADALGDEIKAAGMSASELASRLAGIYGKTFRSPKVSVSIVGFSSQKIYVGGEVGQPGAIPLDSDLSVASALIRAGGTKDTAELKDVVLVRGTEHRTIDVSSILTRNAPDVALQPGDMIYVPKSTVNIYVGGEVSQPGLETLQGNITALMAVIKAGGALHTASLRSVILIRNNTSSGKPEVRKIDLRATLKGTGEDIALQPFDVIYVPRSNIAKADQFVDQYMRQITPIPLNGGFSYLLNSAVVVQ
jgi:polysaccharide biosynthesis/export protein